MALFSWEGGAGAGEGVRAATAESVRRTETEVAICAAESGESETCPGRVGERRPLGLALRERAGGTVSHAASVAGVGPLAFRPLPAVLSLCLPQATAFNVAFSRRSH